MPSYSLCCLSSINLSKLVKNPFTDIAEFDYGRFKELIHMGVRFLDNVLDVTEYPLDKIKHMSTQWRRIGLGITGLADAMLKLGIRYGGKNSIDFTSELGKVLAIESYTSSMELAREKGSFPAFDENIGNYGFIKKLPKELQQDIKKYGLRNIGLNTTAPVGTTSLTVGNNCSSGIEPIFALQYDRTVRNDDNSTYTETVYDDGWLEYLQYCSDNHVEIDPSNLPKYVVTSHEVKIKEGIDVQAAFQYWIDHSISRTINMPYETTLEEYKDIFMYAWEKKLKGITSFHEGASMAGVLSTNNKSKQRYAKKRPEILPCEIYEMQIDKNRVIALVGLLDDRPYEVFLTDDPDGIISVKHAKIGNIAKVKTGKYDLHIESKRGEYILHDISSVFDDEWGTLGRLVSMSLRHNVPLQFIVDQLSKTRKFNTFSKGMARVLKKYIKDGEKALSANKCPECGSELVFIEGCKSCPQCGFSKCD
jgi:ribonucleoside-diphosphate reductase alpha chain